MLIAHAILMEQQASLTDLPNIIDTSNGYIMAREQSAMSYRVKVDRLIRYNPTTSSQQDTIKDAAKNTLLNDNVAPIQGKSFLHRP